MIHKHTIFSNNQAVHAAAKAQEEALDQELHELEGMDDDDLERMREQRLRQMKKMHQQKIQLKRLGHGTYTEVHNEREFFEAGKKSKLVACHFYRPTTKHCLVVDKHFQKLCKKHIGCRFIKINAEKSPYLCEKLNIWMMPSIVLIKNRKTEHTIVGFDELGGTDKFTSYDMSCVLAKHGMVELDS